MASTKAPAAERFWPKVDQSSPHGCWLWNAALDRAGYGRFYDGARVGSAHRFAYEQVVGPIPAGLELDHLCRTRRCVNPAHLEPVTHAENQRRIRKEQCVNGHAYDEANTHTDHRGRRSCRACNRDQSRALRARRAAA